MTTRPLIFDFSYWEGKLDGAAIAATGAVGTSMRATHGLDIDPTYYPDLKISRENNLYTGSYHYFLAGKEPLLQAQRYYDVVNEGKGTDFPPCIDLELRENEGFSPLRLSTKAKICIDRIEQLFGKKPLIYTGFYIWRDNYGSPGWGILYDLWIARYGPEPLIPAPWKTWRLWQYTDRQPYENHTADANWFNGSSEDLKVWLGLRATVEQRLDDLEARVQILEEGKEVSK